MPASGRLADVRAMRLRGSTDGVQHADGRVDSLEGLIPADRRLTAMRPERRGEPGRCDAAVTDLGVDVTDGLQGARLRPLARRVGGDPDVLRVHADADSPARVVDHVRALHSVLALRGSVPQSRSGPGAPQPSGEAGQRAIPASSSDLALPIGWVGHGHEGRAT